MLNNLPTQLKNINIDTIGNTNKVKQVIKEIREKIDKPKVIKNDINKIKLKNTKTTSKLIYGSKEINLNKSLKIKKLINEINEHIDKPKKIERAIRRIKYQNKKIELLEQKKTYKEKILVNEFNRINIDRTKFDCITSIRKVVDNKWLVFDMDLQKINTESLLNLKKFFNNENIAEITNNIGTVGIIVENTNNVYTNLLKTLANKRTFKEAFDTLNKIKKQYLAKKGYNEYLTIKFIEGYYTHIAKKFEGKKFNLISPKIKRGEAHIEKIKNTEEKMYIGFDTEWQNIDYGINYILSAQYYVEYEDFKKAYIILVKDRRYGIEEFAAQIFEDMANFFDINKIKKIDKAVQFGRAEFLSMDYYQNVLNKRIKPDAVLLKTKEKVAKKNKAKYKIHWLQISKGICGAGELHVRIKKKTYKFEINIYDTFLLSNSSLKSLGEAIGMPKLENTDIKSMHSLLNSNFLAYTLYAVNDAYVTIEWFKAFDKIIKDRGIADTVVKTASGLATAYMKKWLGDDFDKTFGYFYDKKQRRQYKEIYNFYKVYHGGYNMAFKYGLYEDKIFYDYDIKNCYPTALLAFEDIEWGANPILLTAEDIAKINKDKNIITNYFEYNDIGIIYLKTYKFKNNIMPNFVHSTDYGLIPVTSYKSPAEGNDMNKYYGVTIQEALTAIKNNWLDSIEIVGGFKLQKAGTHNIADAIKYLIVERNKTDKKHIFNTILKLIANSIYGKTAEGVRSKNSLDIAETLASGKKTFNKIPKGQMFNLAIASYITSCASSILAEYVNKYRKHVYNAITDGFMADIELPNTELCGAGWLGERIAKNRKEKLENENETLIELKHKGKGLLSWRLRGATMLESIEKFELLIERGGIQIPEEYRYDNKKTIEYLTHMYMRRNPHLRYRQTKLSNLAECMLTGRDMCTEVQVKSANFDFDMKLKPVNIFDINNVIYADTKPYRNLTEFYNYKKAYLTMVPKVNKIRNKAEFLNFEKYLLVNQYADEGTHTGGDIEKMLVTKIIRKLYLAGKKPAEIADILHISAEYVTKTANNFKKQIEKLNSKIAELEEKIKITEVNKDLKCELYKTKTKLNKLLNIKILYTDIKYILKEWILKNNIELGKIKDILSEKLYIEMQIELEYNIEKVETDILLNRNILTENIENTNKNIILVKRKADG